jgi:5-amino-6-(5-phospho-D-ribitylamino)uracil phosphatase
MTNRYKLLVSDIDGTLVDQNGKIAEADRAALNSVRRDGMMVSLCTGRAARGCLKVIEDLSLDGFHIFCDGALVCNPDQTQIIYSGLIPPELLIQVYRFAESHNMALELFTQTGFFVSHASAPASLHSRLIQFPYIITDLEKIIGSEKIIMGCIVTNSVEEEEKIKAFSAGFSSTLRFSWTRHPSSPDYYYINITLPGVSKGQALAALISYLGLTKNQVMAIGDGSNDVSLLSAAGLAIAMQHSPDDLKAVADYVTADVEHNGVAQAICRFLVD